MRLDSLSKMSKGSEKILILLSLRKSFCRFLVDENTLWSSLFIPFRVKSRTCSLVQLARSWSESDLILLSFKDNATVSSGKRSGTATRFREEQSTAVPSF